MKIVATCIFATVLALSACGSGDTYPEDEAMSSEEIGAVALQETWDGMSTQDQEDICGGWYLIQEEIIDTVREGNEDYLTREDVRVFLNDKCVDQFTEGE